MGFKLDQTFTEASSVPERKGGLDELIKKEITLFRTFFNSKKKEAFYADVQVEQCSA